MILFGTGQFTTYNVHQAEDRRCTARGGFRFELELALVSVLVGEGAFPLLPLLLLLPSLLSLAKKLSAEGGGARGLSIVGGATRAFLESG